MATRLLAQLYQIIPSQRYTHAPETCYFALHINPWKAESVRMQKQLREYNVVADLLTVFQDFVQALADIKISDYDVHASQYFSDIPKKDNHYGAPF